MFSAARNATSVMFLPFYEPDEEHSHTTHTLFGNQTQDGKLVYTNPYAEMVSGFKKSSSSMMTSQVELTHTFENALEGLVLSGIFNLKRDSYYDLQRGFVPFYYAPVAGLSNDEYRLQSLNPDDGTEYLDFNGGNKYVTSTLYGELRANYTKTIAEKHNITAMLVGTIRNASTTEVWSLYESLPNRNISLSGRLAYGYDSRYFIEGNFGYNGSERFAKSHRFGFFPSIGLGWMISNEKFMQPGEKGADQTETESDLRTCRKRPDRKSQRPVFLFVEHQHEGRRVHVRNGSDLFASRNRHKPLCGSRHHVGDRPESGFRRGTRTLERIGHSGGLLF